MKKRPMSSIVLMLAFVWGCASPIIADLEQDEVLVQDRSNAAAMGHIANVAPAAGPMEAFAALPEPPPPPETIPLPPGDFSVGLKALPTK